jgi:riboflavin synthase
MFTGIVEELGEVAEAGGGRLIVRCNTVLEDATVGASIAVNGVCLTVTDLKDGTAAFDLSPETLSRTTLGQVKPGDPVNLERPLTLTTRLGGHLVQGHVDAVGSVTSVERNGEGASMVVEASPQLAPYLVEKGSVAVDGVSLTVASANGTSFGVALVPHTLAVTTLGGKEPGDLVNLEADLIAKYVERMVNDRE